MNKPDTKTDKARKPYKPRALPFIESQPDAPEPYALFKAVTFARQLKADNPPEIAVCISATYNDLEPETIAFHLGRCDAFNWKKPALADAFKKGLRAGFEETAKGGKGGAV
ncbi:MAG: hypothetical protein JJU29_12595 [Verrucomicrobia bacterium]|nr:hypothetical protein [Verrucomicrobiota bacterium]MCH8510845.1 hypothetical protein [Kiritimatiellia bacterium]